MKNKIKIHLSSYILSIITLYLGYLSYFLFRGDPVEIIDEGFSMRLLYNSESYALLVATLLPIILFIFLLIIYSEKFKLKHTAMVILIVLYMPAYALSQLYLRLSISYTVPSQSELLYYSPKN